MQVLQTDERIMPPNPSTILLILLVCSAPIFPRRACKSSCLELGRDKSTTFCEDNANTLQVR